MTIEKTESAKQDGVLIPKDLIESLLYHGQLGHRTSVSNICEKIKKLIKEQGLNEDKK